MHLSKYLAYHCNYRKLRLLYFWHKSSIIFSCIMRKPAFCICVKQRRRSAVLLLCSAFVFTTWIVQSLYFLNPKLAILCCCTAKYVSNLVRNPINRRSRDTDHIVPFVKLTDN